MFLGNHDTRHLQHGVESWEQRKKKVVQNLFLLWNKVSLHNPGWPRSHYVGEAGLKLLCLQVLRLKACTTMLICMSVLPASVCMCITCKGAQLPEPEPSSSDAELQSYVGCITEMGRWIIKIGNGYQVPSMQQINQSRTHNEFEVFLAKRSTCVALTNCCLGSY